MHSSPNSTASGNWILRECSKPVYLGDKLLDGAFKLPSIKQNEKDVLEWDKYMKQYSDKYYRRSCIGALHIWYNDLLCKDIGWNPKRKKGFIAELIDLMAQRIMLNLKTKAQGYHEFESSSLNSPAELPETVDAPRVRASPHSSYSICVTEILTRCQRPRVRHHQNCIGSGAWVRLGKVNYEHPLSPDPKIGLY
ncbi:hypothetical protein HYC85_002366 [Camellia sinensis]|uniref:Uncharacterized protein n=1 Tax=Camellia sinensis TaxID=4442 RepID=A0A7J7I9H2_CAMSI|nr:hypothetical protein HYC85_002366 [Camellia sinensis]